jgi:hypothetical protein
VYALANYATSVTSSTVPWTSATPIGFLAAVRDAKRDCLRSHWLFIGRLDVDTIPIGFF